MPPATEFDDPAGNMVDDAKNYTYVYDVFGRLNTVKTRGGSPVTVSEYTCNGLGHRVGWHYDADTDADVDGSDPWYWFFYDERWRMVATYRGSDSNPKERFVYHNAGASGYGGSSYIDSTILRDTDDSVGWNSAVPDSTLQTRYYYLQNWRADVVALIEADGDPVEYVRYSPYGVPYVYGAGDVNRDGQVNILDNYAWDDFDQSGTGDMAVDDDVNRDGTVDSDDVQLITDQDGWGAWAGDGRGFVSGVSSRKGYAGYEFDPATTQWHVRNRVLVSEMGRWGRRDPVGYVDGSSLFQYSQLSPTGNFDPSGLRTVDITLLPGTHLVQGGACHGGFTTEAEWTFDIPQWAIDSCGSVGSRGGWLIQRIQMHVDQHTCDRSMRWPIIGNFYEAWKVSPKGQIMVPHPVQGWSPTPRGTMHDRFSFPGGGTDRSVSGGIIGEVKYFCDSSLVGVPFHPAGWKPNPERPSRALPFFAGELPWFTCDGGCSSHSLQVRSSCCEPLINNPNDPLNSGMSMAWPTKINGGEASGYSTKYFGRI